MKREIKVRHGMWTVVVGGCEVEFEIRVKQSGHINCDHIIREGRYSDWNNGQNQLCDQKLN